MDRTIVVSMIAMVVWACSGQKSEEPNASQEPNGGFLLSEDFEAGDHVDTMSDEELQLSMTLVEDFRYYPTTYRVTRQDQHEMSSAEILEECFTERLGQVLISAEENRLWATGEIEIGDCLMEAANQENTELIDYQHTMQVFVEFTCNGIDLTMYDGVSLAEFREYNDHPCRITGGGTARHQLQHEILTRKKLLLDGKEIVSEVGAKIIDASSGTNGKPACDVKTDGELLTITNCQEIHRDIITRQRTSIAGVNQIGDEEGREQFHRVEYRTPVRANPETGRFDKGRLYLEKSNWSGEMIFESEEKPATWIMYSENKTLTGKLDIPVPADAEDPVDETEDDTPAEDADPLAVND